MGTLNSFEGGTIGDHSDSLKTLPTMYNHSQMHRGLRGFTGKLTKEKRPYTPI